MDDRHKDPDVTTLEDGAASAAPERSPEVTSAQLAASRQAGTRSRLWLWALLFVVGSVWSVTFSLAKIAAVGGAHPIGITFWQAVIAAVVLLALEFCRRRRLPLDRHHLKFFLICGLLGTVVPSTIFFYAAAKVPAGVLAITLASVPILTFAVAVILGIEKIALSRIVGILLGILAVLLIALPESSLPDPAAVPWVLVAFVAAACYAAENLYIAIKRPADSDAVTILAGMMVMASLILAPIVVATDSFVPLTWPLGPVELSIIGMALVTTVAYALFFYIIAAAGPVFAAQMGYVVTLTGIVWGIIIFGEQHSHWIWAALLCMMVGLTLVKPRKSEG